MAVVPLKVATKGYLDTPLAVAVTGYLGGLIPGIPEGWLGGVVVLANTWGTRLSGGLVAAAALRAAQSAITIIPGLDAMIAEKPGAEVIDEDVGV